MQETLDTHSPQIYSYGILVKFRTNLNPQFSSRSLGIPSGVFFSMCNVFMTIPFSPLACINCQRVSLLYRMFLDSRMHDVLLHDFHDAFVATDK